MNTADTEGSRQLLMALGWIAAASVTCLVLGVSAGVAAGMYWAKSNWIESCDTIGWIAYNGHTYECTYWAGEEEPVFDQASVSRESQAIDVQS